MKSLLFVLVMAGCMAVPGLAAARPRDEAMSGAFRCAAIGDSRNWLDCYYGAAQPVRAQLGLAPASAGQLRLAQSPPPGTPADVAVRDSVLSGAFACNRLAEDRQWLDCYYAAAQPMRAQLGLSPAPQARMAPPPAPPPAAAASPPSDQQFGLASRGGQIVSRMAAYSFDQYGVFTAELANGQVWHQVGSDSVLAHWDRPAATYVVTISQGIFGSYDFKVDGKPGMYKVRRER